ncbi:MAG TPA: hypothetical protein QF665_06090 [Alphaproteobacteria bacterium]|nr:hypothetical protein [Alphaproteobacteria bacterium]
MRTASFAALGLALALGACASEGLVKVTNVTQASGFSMGHVQYAAARGEVFAEIRGTAFDSQTAGSEEAIASSLRLPNLYPRARITTRPSEGARTSQRLAFVFNPDRPPGAALMCSQIDRVPVAPPGVETHAQAAFCSGERLLAQAHAVGPAALGPEDPAFQDLMRQVLVSLLRNPAADRVSFQHCVLQDCL